MYPNTISCQERVQGPFVQSKIRRDLENRVTVTKILSYHAVFYPSYTKHRACLESIQYMLQIIFYFITDVVVGCFCVSAKFLYSATCRGPEDNILFKV